MTASRKHEIIAQIVGILNELIAVDDSEEMTKHTPYIVEMLTIKESTEVVKGLSEHTIRKLIHQGKLPYVRTGEGVNGKILINKVDLLAFFNKQQTMRSAC